MRKHPGQPGSLEIKQVATLPLQVLSGRTGRHLWSAGPLPLGFEAYGYSSIVWVRAGVAVAHGATDVFVRHAGSFVPSHPVMTPAGGPAQPRLARVSGRDGRILWDIPLSEHQDPNNMGWLPEPSFADLDGDGALDVVVPLHASPGTGRLNHELRAVSLRDGRLLWSLALDFKNSFNTSPQVAVADLDGDKRPEVLVTEHPADGDKQAFALKALEGRDGTVRWTWNGGVPETPTGNVFGWLALADFDGDGRRSACMSFHATQWAVPHHRF